MAEYPSIHVRVSPEIKKAIQDRIDKGEYEDITEFVLKAIKSQLDPDKDRKKIEAYLMDLLENEPEKIREKLGIKA